jgi:adenylate cyclase
VDKGDASAGPADPPSTADRFDEVLLGGRPSLTLGGLAEAAGVSVTTARGFWRSLGFPDVDPSAVVFTQQDVRALQVVDRLLERGVVDERTTTSVLRAIGHVSDRLALWQTESLVEDVARRFTLDDTTARILYLDRLPDVVPELEELLGYGWRRLMAALVRRTHDEVSLSRSDVPDASRLPLARAVGFADLVAFTRRSAGLGPQALGALVEAFEDTARDVVTAAGARVVKMIGDAVLFVADDLRTGAQVSLDLLDAIRALPADLSLRSSLVWGRVLSRSGDVFGATVNLAARLADVAEPGTVLMDRASAATLAQAGMTGIALVPQYPTEVSGLGLVAPVELRRSQPMTSQARRRSDETEPTP